MEPTRTQMKCLRWLKERGATKADAMPWQKAMLDRMVAAGWIVAQPDAMGPIYSVSPLGRETVR